MNMLPGRPLGKASYWPSEIAASMSFENERPEISKGLRRRWLRDREKIYHYLWDGRLNMIGWTMLGRAIRILREELTPKFFLMTNKEAFHLMRLKMPKLARAIKNMEFKILFDRRYSLLKGEAQKLSDPTNLKKVEDEICRETRLEEWSIGLTVDQPHIKEKADHWRVYLVGHNDSEQPKTLLNDILSCSEPLPSDN